MAYSFPYPDLLIADDDYSLELWIGLLALAKQTQDTWDTFTKMLSNIQQEGVMDGNLATQVTEFTKDIQEIMGTLVFDLMCDTSSRTRNYIQEINSSDDCLY